MDVKTCAMIPIDEHQDLKSTVKPRRIHRTQEVISKVFPPWTLSGEVFESRPAWVWNT